MKTIRRLAPLVTLTLVAGALSACAGPHRGGGMPHSNMASMDMQAMCEMHRKMMSDKSHEARMQEHMKSMTPEMRQRAMAMHEQCK